MHMKLSIVGLALPLTICVLQLNGAPKKSEELKVLSAGDTITFNLNLDPVPDFQGGRVAVLVCPLYDDAEFLLAGMVSSAPQLSRVSSTETVANRGQYDVSVQIPEDAPDGVWHAFFSFSLPNGNYRELTHASTAFRVQGRRYSQTPRYATQIGVRVTNVAGRQP